MDGFYGKSQLDKVPRPLHVCPNVPCSQLDLGTVMMDDMVGFFEGYKLVKYVFSFKVV